jgi:hypothetical protein
MSSIGVAVNKEKVPVCLDQRAIHLPRGEHPFSTLRTDFCRKLLQKGHSGLKTLQIRRETSWGTGEQHHR